MDAATEKRGTHQKALTINLDATAFGSFAEIGAGQEVARWFLRVGGASGTVAKTISAYDKEVSDDLYGAGTRYVSKPRLQAMLDNEWAQLLTQLQPTRGATTRFFSFVDTVSARNYSGTNDCHGWVGLRFMQQPNGPINDVILHVNLRDPSNELQQEAVGVLGVNLLYAAYHEIAGPNEFLTSVFEDLDLARMEIDCVELSGPAFDSWDKREIHCSLVAGCFAQAVFFPADGELAPPNEALYKRALVLTPARIAIADQRKAEMLRITLRDIPPEEVKESKGTLGSFCLSPAPGQLNVRTLPAKEMVALVERLRKTGYGVMLFRAPELYEMGAFVSRYTKCRTHFALGLAALVRVLEDSYRSLPGTLLEGIARVFAQNVRLVVHPMAVGELEQWLKETGLTGWTWDAKDGMVHADGLKPAKPLDYLYKYLLSELWILPKA